MEKKGMKALILVGGFGTRLRPLTFKKPKPLVEFANRPMMEFQIEALSKCGVSEIILGIGYQPDVMMDFGNDMKKKYGVNIVYSHEKTPLGTFGAVKLAEKQLLENNESGRFFVCNADIICNYPFQQMIDFMDKNEGTEGVMVLTKVRDPSKYGVVLFEDDGKVNRFVEKPKEWVGDCINAGMYLLDGKVLNRLQEFRKCSIEREIFPAMVQENKLFAITLDGHWMDIGQPKDFVTAIGLHLDFLKSQGSDLLAPEDGKNIIGNVLIHPTAKVSPDAVVGPNVTIGENCVVEAGARLYNVALLDGATVNSNTWIERSIVGWSSTVGRWCRIEGVTVIAENVTIKDELYVNSSFILPHKTLSLSLPQAGSIIM